MLESLCNTQLIPQGTQQVGLIFQTVSLSVFCEAKSFPAVTKKYVGYISAQSRRAFAQKEDR